MRETVLRYVVGLTWKDVSNVRSSAAGCVNGKTRTSTGTAVVLPATVTETVPRYVPGAAVRGTTTRT